jgi:hypothetical protein
MIGARAEEVRCFSASFGVSPDCDFERLSALECYRDRGNPLCSGAFGICASRCAAKFGF